MKKPNDHAELTKNPHAKKKGNVFVTILSTLVQSMQWQRIVTTLMLCNIDPYYLHKGATIATRPANKWLWLNALDYLPVCYTQCPILAVLYVVCYQSVTRNSNTTSSYVYNREFITQPTPINHSNGKLKFWIWRPDFFSNSCFWWFYQKYFIQ